MATKKIKINFKMPTPTAAERLHAQQQKNRKAAGLPDPSEYKKKLDSMKSEEVEPLDEISPQLKASYVAGAKKQIKQSEPYTKKGEEYRDIAKNFIAKRQKGIARANEEVEQLDEMPESNMKTKDVHSHLKKSGWSLARSKGGHDVYKHPKAKHSIPVPRHNQLKAPLIRGIMKASKVEEQLEKKGRFVSGPIKQPFKSNTIVTSVKEAAPQDEHFAKQSQKMRDAINTHLRRGHSYENAVKLAKRHVKEEVGQMDEKKNLPGLWANIHARREKGLPRKKPGQKGYPKTLNIESAQEPTEGEMKGKQQGVSRKAQIVMDAAKGKKSDNPDKFQKDPELSSEIHKT